MPQPNFYLLFKGIKIHQANAISGPFSYGFPAIGGFVGAIHHLGRKMAEITPAVQVGGVLISCNSYDLQATRPHQYADYTFVQTRNPLKSDGKSASIIEEGKIHLNINLVVELFVEGDMADDLTKQAQSQQFCQQVSRLLHQQRIAGGSVLNIANTQVFQAIEHEKILHAIQPAFVLMDATLELQAITQSLQTGLRHYVNDFNEIKCSNTPIAALPAEPNATALDALLALTTLHHFPTRSTNGDTEWTTYNVKTGRGWLVPIPIGYQGIYPPFAAGELQHARNPDYPSQYVETVYSLGKWVFPRRLQHIDFSHCFWRYTAPQHNLYCYSQGA